MDVDTLLAPRADTASGMPEDDVPTPVGTVRVRGLTRTETLEAQAGADDSLAAWEQALITRGMVDPPLTAEQAAQWQRTGGANELRDVVNKIIALSGLGAGADKAAYKSDGDESGA